MDHTYPNYSQLHPRTNKEVEPKVDLPFWAKLVLAALKLIPGIPSWVAVIFQLIVVLLENLPLSEKKAAEKELYESGKKALKGDTKEVEAIARKYWLRCNGQILSTDLGTTGVKIDPLPGQDKPTKTV